MTMKTKLFMLLTMMFVSMGAFAQSSAIQGDVNNDGKVDVADIVKVIDIMQQGSSEPGDDSEFYWFAAQTNPTLPEVDPESFEVDNIDENGNKLQGWFTLTEEQLSAGKFAQRANAETAGTWYVALPVEGNWKLTANDYHTLASGTINHGTITYKTKLYNVWEIEGTYKRMNVFAAKIN